MAVHRVGVSLRSSWQAGSRAQCALAERWARPRKLVVASYLFFSLAFLSLFPGLASVAVGALALNGVITLAGTTLLAAVEGRFAPRLRARDVPLVDRSLQYATLIWLYGGAIFAWFAIANRI